MFDSSTKGKFLSFRKTILDRDGGRRVLQTSSKKGSFAFGFIVGKENRNSPLRREREREEDAKKTLEESGRVERKEEEEEEGGCETSVGRFLDLAPTFSLRCFAWPSALKGWTGRNASACCNDFRARNFDQDLEPVPIFPSGSASRTKLSPRGETIGGERNWRVKRKAEMTNERRSLVAWAEDCFCL